MTKKVSSGWFANYITILALLTTATRQAGEQWRRRLPDAETAGGAN
jgi:hypothetical protein